MLSSCATNYGVKSFKGGYSEKKINENTYKVTFLANVYTEYELIKKYFLYRCAEITLNENHKYFSICDKRKGCTKKSTSNKLTNQETNLDLKIENIPTKLYGTKIMKIFKNKDNTYAEILFKAENIKKHLEPYITRGSNKAFKK